MILPGMNALELTALVGLLACSALFSGSETALFSLRQGQLRTLRTRPGLLGALVLRLALSPQQLLVTLLLSNVFVNVLFFCLMAQISFAVHRSHGAAAGTAVGVAALFLVIIFGEVGPKVIAVTRPLPFALATAAPLMAVHLALWPVRCVVNRLVSAILRVVGFSYAGRYITADELRALVDLSRQKGAIDAVEEAMLTELVDLHDVKVREIMVPRVDMVMLKLDGAGSGDLLDLAEARNVRLIPVYEDTIDHVVGHVDARAVYLDPGRPLRSYVQPLASVPESKSVESLLEDFRRQRIKLALVVDEYGGTAGLVTIEDVCEEVVGEIRDEFDPHTVDLVRQIDAATFVVDARLTVRDWQQLFGLDVDDERPDTVGGFVAALLGHVPRQGDQVLFRNIRFTVTEVQGRRVLRLEMAYVAPQDLPGHGHAGPDNDAGEHT